VGRLAGHPGEDKTRLMTFERALPGCIVVNQAGKRYFNEAASYHIAGHAMIENNKKGASTIPSYILFDSQYRHAYPMGPVLPLLPDWILSSAIKSVLIKGKTWEEVAKKAGLPWAPLKETIENFNKHAREGKDPEFLRGDDPYDCYYGDRRSSRTQPCEHWTRDHFTPSLVTQATSAPMAGSLSTRTRR